MEHMQDQLKELEEDTPITKTLELEAAIGRQWLVQIARDETNRVHYTHETDGMLVIEEQLDGEIMDSLETIISNYVKNGGAYYSRDSGRYYDTWPFGAGQPFGWSRAEQPNMVEFWFDAIEHPDSIREIICSAIAQEYEERDMEARHDAYMEVVAGIADELRENKGLETDIPLLEWQEYLVETCGIVFEPGWVKGIEDAQLLANIHFNIGEERNVEHTAIFDAAYAITEGVEDGMPVTENNRESFEDNSLTWLLATQGKSWADYIRNIDTREDAFLNSVEDELANATYSIEELTLCARMTFSQYAQLLTGASNYVVDPNARSFTMGLHDPIHGAGGGMNLAPEKPFVIGHDIIYSIDCEASNKHYMRYTPGETFGLSRACWASCLTPTDEQISGLDGGGGLPCVDMGEIGRAANEVHQARTAGVGGLEGTAPERAPERRSEPRSFSEIKAKAARGASTASVPETHSKPGKRDTR